MIMITLLVLLCFLNTSFTNDNSYTIKISIRYDCIDNDHILIYNKITNQSTSSLLTWIDYNLDFSSVPKDEINHLITYYTRNYLFEQWGGNRSDSIRYYYVINYGFIKSIPPKGSFTYIIIAEKSKLNEVLLKYKKCIHYIDFDIVSKHLYDIDNDKYLCYPIDYIVIREL